MNEALPLPSSLPALRSPEVQSAVDAEHLRLLKITYYIAGSVTAVFSCFFILHFAMFLVLGLNPQFFNNHGSNSNNRDVPPPPGLFLGLAAAIGLVILLGWTFGALQIYAGRCLGRRAHPTFVTFIAALECLFIPWGTALGVFTFMVLNRPSVKALFLLK